MARRVVITGLGIVSPLGKDAASFWSGLTERKSGVMQLRRGFRVEPGERILLAEDVVTTAGSALETRTLLEDQGAVVVGITSIVDRGESKDLPVPFRALIALRAPVWTPEECPLCTAGGTPVKPGGERRAAPAV